MNKAKRRAVIAGNWKMNKNRAEARELITALLPLVKDADCEVVICTPFTNLETAVKLTAGTNIKVGAQNCHWAEKGAFTGEISVAMLQELGVQYVIVGHSERREYFGESDATVNARLKAALAGGLCPILCVGETLAERESGETSAVILREIREDLAEVSAEDFARVIIAYEPIWAIGTGRTATNEQAAEVCGEIRKTLAAMYGEKAAAAATIQYGGSMNPANAEGLLDMEDIDGGLIGGASLKAPDFAAIVAAASR